MNKKSIFSNQGRESGWKWVSGWKWAQSPHHCRDEQSETSIRNHCRENFQQRLVLYTPFEAPEPGFSGSPEQGHSVSPTEWVGLGLRDMKMRQKQEASDLAGLITVGRSPGRQAASAPCSSPVCVPGLGRVAKGWSNPCAPPGAV